MWCVGRGGGCCFQGGWSPKQIVITSPLLVITSPFMYCLETGSVICVGMVECAIHE